MYLEELTGSITLENLEVESLLIWVSAILPI